MSKMGISTLQSYRGAQIFEAIGLEKDFVDRYFTWTASRIGGIGIDAIAEEVRARHEQAFPDPAGGRARSRQGGEYQWRPTASTTCSTPRRSTSCSTRRAAASTRSTRNTRRLVNDQNTQARDAARAVRAQAGRPRRFRSTRSSRSRASCKRFATGAMSYGSISKEAHETLAIAMNRIGGKSNTGEGGEDPARYVPDANGDSRQSAIKQVASARFGVTSEYLVNADELQIKMAQGAKPGEGGQLPGHKVDPWIAKVRHATPGVGLISPPPHHDIYSIEDLAQLILRSEERQSAARAFT